MAWTRSPGVWIALLVGAALFGLTVFTVLASRSVHVEQLDATEALHRFEEMRAEFRSQAPLVRWGAAGRAIKRESPGTQGARPTQLHVFAYRSAEERLFQADVPLWFFKVKGPAVEYALRGTDFDLAALGLTAGDLERSGAGLVLDETRTNGDRLLAWTQ